MWYAGQASGKRRKVAPSMARRVPLKKQKANGYELQSKGGGDSMPNGYGFGRGGRGWGMGYGFGRGMGFGFRGASPPWPYVGRGRGGLPRCRYPGAFTRPAYWPGSAPYSPQTTKEQELAFLKETANATRGQLEEIEARIKELEVK